MIRWIVGLSLRLPGLFMAIAVGLLAFGIVQLRHSKVDAMPEFGPPIVEIQTESLGLSASEVEQLITVPLEQDYLVGVPGVAAVSMWLERARQLQVQVDPKRLCRYGISMHEILETTGNALWASPLTFLAANTPGSGGFIDQSNQRLGIQHLQPIRTAA